MAHGLQKHQRDFPDYKYQPMRKEDKARMKEARDREKALARKERALDKAMRELTVKVAVRTERPTGDCFHLGAMIAPRKSRAKAKAIPQPPSMSPSPEPAPVALPTPPVQPFFDVNAYRDASLAETPKQTVSARSPKKTGKKPRKSAASAKSKRLHVVTDPRDCGIMDGAQVFWAGPPDIREF